MDWPKASVFKHLFEELTRKKLHTESISRSHQEVTGIEFRSRNPDFKPENFMDEADSFRGQKILICCFHTENTRVQPIFLQQQYKPDELCVKEVLESLGFTVEIVINHRHAIKKMRSGHFSSVWIICSSFSRELPGWKRSCFNQSISSMC